jgi:hypothetical protein
VITELLKLLIVQQRTDFQMAVMKLSGVVHEIKPRSSAHQLEAKQISHSSVPKTTIEREIRPKIHPENQVKILKSTLLQ